MDTLTILASVAGLWAIAAVTPGPNFLVVAETALARSRRHAFCAVAGTILGTVFWGLAGFFGVTLLFAAAPWLHVTLKVVGGLYIAYLGVRLIAASVRRGPDDASADAGGGFSRAAALRRGLLTNLANPKTAAFAASLFAATMPEAPSLTLGLACVAVMAAVSLAWYGVLACALATRGIAAAYGCARRWIDRAAGMLFLGFGAKFAADS